MIALLMSLALQASCAAPAGTAALFGGDHRFIIIGERHGSAEVPAAFTAIVCEAASSGAVTVALELPQAMQPQLDAFLAAGTDEEAVSRLAGTPFLDPTMDDGRTSQAMLEMMQAVRRMRSQGKNVALAAFQPSTPMPAELPQSYYELEMGYLLSRTVVERPNARVVALVGSVHASKRTIATLSEVGLPAAAHLPADQVLSIVVVRQGGQTWSCGRDGGCGPNDQGMAYEGDARGIIMGPYHAGAYDGVLALGPLTFSPPISLRDR